jgi:ferredoxin
MAAGLLRDGQVSTVLGWVPGPMPDQMIPGFVTAEADAALLGWNERCHANLATYLAGPNRAPGKVAVVLKKCDARSVTTLLQEAQIARDDVSLIGVSCAGVVEDGRLARKCYACDGAVADVCDATVSSTAVSRATAPDPRDAEIAFLESLPPRERWSFWQDQFADCIRCYACRAVCPMCYCGSCVSEQHRPQWIPTAIEGKGNTAWNLVRAYHLAGRCVGCDACARVCPANIRLDLINRRLALEIERRYDYRPGESTEGAPPLAAFRPEDPQEFIL